MDAQIDILKKIAEQAGYRFERDRHGTERMFGPDGETVLTAGSRIPEAAPIENIPEGIEQDVDGGYSRVLANGSATIRVRVCEDCWQVIPTYVDFPRGLVSPESDGDINGLGAKTKIVSVGEGGKMGMAHLQKIVCLPCYLLAFSRMYPGYACPDMNDKVRDTHISVPSVLHEEWVSEPKGVRA